MAIIFGHSGGNGHPPPPSASRHRPSPKSDYSRKTSVLGKLAGDPFIPLYSESLAKTRPEAATATLLPVGRQSQFR